MSSEELELELELQKCFESRYPKYVCCCEVIKRGTIATKKQWFEKRKVVEICINCRLLIKGEIYNEPRIKNVSP